ncbi:MAG: flagellar brake protein [Propionivibrio sp.]
MEERQEPLIATAPEQSPPQFELEQTDDYSQYLLHSRSEILAVLRSLVQKGALITVYFDQGKSFLLTSMLALDADNQRFVLDLGSNDEMNQRALLAKKLILTTVVDKVKIQFSLNALNSAQYESRRAFVGAIPDTLLRLQRREYFRLSTPIANPIKLTTTIRRADDSVLQVSLPLLDISGGGVGLMVASDQAQLLERGATLDECRLMLPDEGLLVTSLGVRNMFDVTTRSGTRYVRVGCEYIGLTSARLAMVQRYITRMERERKARLNGLA